MPDYVEKSLVHHLFPRRQERSRARLTPIIGEDASLAVGRAGALLLVLALLGLVIIAMVVTTQFLGGPILLSITLVLSAAWLLCFVMMERYGQRANTLARQHVSAQLGHDIGHITGTAAPGSWLKSIHRMETRQSRQTARDARTQQWLDRKQEKSEEYRRQHPQDPGQGG